MQKYYELKLNIKALNESAKNIVLSNGNYKNNYIRKTITSLFDDLQKFRKIKEFNTGKCNQDFVENFFSRMLSGVGNRVNPTASEFSSEFLKKYINELFTKIEGSNCELILVIF